MQFSGKIEKFLRISLFFGLAVTAGAASAQSISVPELRRTFPTVQAAVNAIGAGEATVLLAPGSYRQCAVQNAGTITYRASQPGTAIFDGITCEGKAALVLRGAGATVDGLVFQNMRVADHNGAGIRLERGELRVVNALFRNSEQGILSANDHRGAVTIDRSTFTRLGTCDYGACTHSMYLNGRGLLTVTRSRFERGTGGHYVKSRMDRANIVDNMFDDSQGQGTNYMIDLPAGAVGRIAGNLFIQGADKENFSAFIAVAAESRDHPSTGLAIADNTARLAPGVERRTFFVANWSGQRLAIGQNMLGAGVYPYEAR
ncbi:MAG: right-handed parallel beta-helix repeat-containing protein [Sphingopyxis sp.]|nr:right-handed parallel beta-helix repeat-containing protein [Sphingopyxis sp.]